MTTYVRSGMVLAALTVGLTGVARAQFATQNVTITVEAINAIAVSDPEVTLSINSATAGNAPDAAQATSTYAITTNEEGQEIAAMLDSGSLPDGLTLEIELAAPTGATPRGRIVLSPQNQIAVSGITRVAASGLQITYTASAAVSVPPGSYQAVVKLTII